MFPVEAATVAGAVVERRREFGTVRWCARRALRRLGVPTVPILPDADRVPRWPAGVVGSMTHCEGYRAAAVARSDELGGIGIDAEPHGPVSAEALELLLRDEERAALRTLADAACMTRRWVVDGLVVAATAIPHLAARSFADASGDREVARR